ncbi:MAG: superoxide dismutase [Ni] [Candidatus Zixiibacteriota bacterium]
MKLKIFLTVIAILALAASTAFAHCQIPCGIYGDDTRFTLLKEDTQTIEKSMKQIVELSAAGDKDFNQIVRWVNNKDEHADKIIDMAANYFLAQRIKPVDGSDAAAAAAYAKKLEKLHLIIVYAMKCKQTTDLANVTKLNTAITEFETLYMGK